MDSFMNAGKEFLEQQMSGSASHGMYRTVVIVIIAPIIIHELQKAQVHNDP